MTWASLVLAHNRVGTPGSHLLELSDGSEDIPCVVSSARVQQAHDCLGVEDVVVHFNLPHATPLASVITAGKTVMVKALLRAIGRLMSLT